MSASAICSERQAESLWQHTEVEKEVKKIEDDFAKIEEKIEDKEKEEGKEALNGVHSESEERLSCGNFWQAL